MGNRGVKTALQQGRLPQEDIKSILLFGGSFDPIHIGHLSLAEYVQKSDLGFDELWFLPTYQNPLKEESSTFFSFEERVDFVQKLIKKNIFFRCCPIERELPSPHYTIHTLQKLRELYPDYRFSLHIGADNWDRIEAWYHWKELLNTTSFIIYPRKGYATSKYREFKNVLFLDQAPCFDNASSRIRKFLKEGKRDDFLIEEGLPDIILKNILKE